MLGRTHALIATTGHLAVCATGTLVGLPPAPSVLIVGALVSAGAAYLPDADLPSSTAGQLLGELTEAASRGIAAGSAAVYRRTRLAGDPSATDGHRTLTHTIVAAFAVGMAVALGCWLGGRPVALAITFVSAALVGRALLPWRRRGALSVLLLATVVTALTGHSATPRSWAWLGGCVFWGWLSHCLSDALTLSGSPLLWPLPIGGRRWRALAPPWRLQCGGMFERWVIVPVCAASSIGLTIYIM